MRPILQTLALVWGLLAVAGCGTLNYEAQTNPQSPPREASQFGGWSPAPRAPLIRF